MWLFLFACSTPTPVDSPVEPSTPAETRSVDELLLAGESTAAVTAARTELDYAKASGDPVREAMAQRVLASALLAGGDPENAEQHARNAVQGFASAGHTGVADAVLLVGQIQGAAGKPVDLPEVDIDPGVLREAVVLRLSTGSTAHLVPAVAALVQRAPSESLHGLLAGLAWQEGEVEIARASATWLRDNGSVQGTFEAGLLLARLEEQVGDPVAAEAALVSTCETAPEPLLGRCQRELGLFLAQLPDRTDDARTQLRLASRSPDPEIAGTALGALGLIEAQEGDEDTARTVLEDALARLPAGHPERALIQSNLESLGTGTLAAAVPLEDQLRVAMQAEIPGLVADVAFDAEGAIELTLTREATPAEQARLQAIQEGILQR